MAHENEAEWAFVAISAVGPGSYGGYEDEWSEDEEWSHEMMRRCVQETIPPLARAELGDGTWDERFMNDREVNWNGWLTRAAWDELRAEWYFDPETDSKTGGIIGVAIDDDGFHNAWAYSSDQPGMDWNIGGVTPVTYVNVYYCAQDEDILAAARRDYPQEEET